MKKITILFFQKLKQLGSNVNEAKSENNQKKKKSEIFKRFRVFNINFNDP